MLQFLEHNRKQAQYLPKLLKLANRLHPLANKTTHKLNLSISKAQEMLKNKFNRKMKSLLLQKKKLLTSKKRPNNSTTMAYMAQRWEKQWQQCHD